LIPRVWRVDPLGCPVCQNPMRVIAAIDDPRASVGSEWRLDKT
jgi:hypothetical protein